MPKDGCNLVCLFCVVHLVASVIGPQEFRLAMLLALGTERTGLGMSLGMHLPEKDVLCCLGQKRKLGMRGVRRLREVLVKGGYGPLKVLFHHRCRGRRAVR